MKCVSCGQSIPDPATPLQVVAGEWPELPIAEMAARGWFGDWTRFQEADDARRALFRFWDVTDAAELREVLGVDG